MFEETFYPVMLNLQPLKMKLLQPFPQCSSLLTSTCYTCVRSAMCPYTVDVFVPLLLNIQISVLIAPC